MAEKNKMSDEEKLENYSKLEKESIAQNKKIEALEKTSKKTEKENDSLKSTIDKVKLENETLSNENGALIIKVTGLNEEISKKVQKEKRFKMKDGNIYTLQLKGKLETIYSSQDRGSITVSTEEFEAMEEDGRIEYLD